MEVDNCTVLVNSCDSYEDTWFPFFKLFKEYWSDCKLPIVLNTERKNFKYDGLNIQTFGLYKNVKRIKDSWSDRLLKTLDKIDSEYIIFLLDDFFIKEKVDVENLEKIFSLINADKDIGAIYFVPVKPIMSKFDKPYLEDNNSKLYVRSKSYNKRRFIKEFFSSEKCQDGLYVVNAQAAIWRKETLVKTLRHGESAWDWETYGTMRATKMKEKFIELKSNTVFIYDVHTGGAIHRGVWVPDVVIPLFEKHGINIDLSIRGIKTQDWDYSVNKKISKKIKTFFRVVKNLSHS